MKTDGSQRITKSPNSIHASHFKHGVMQIKQKEKKKREEKKKKKKRCMTTTYMGKWWQTHIQFLPFITAGLVCFFASTFPSFYRTFLCNPISILFFYNFSTCYHSPFMVFFFLLTFLNRENRRSRSSGLIDP